MKTRCWLAGAGLVLGMLRANACAWEPPIQLLSCRVDCLEQVTSPGFVYGISRAMGTPLPSPDARFYARRFSGEVVDGSDQNPVEVAQQIHSMRQAPTAEEAYQLGKGLPEAKRLYVAGAVQFRLVHHNAGTFENDDASPVQGDVDAGLTAAIGWFERVTALPPDFTEPRFVLATYMLGRAHHLRGHPGDDDLAVKEYRRTLDLLAHGAPDPLNLATAALGELGRIALDQGHTHEALALYAQQASKSPPVSEGGGLMSLWRVLGAIADDDDKLAQELRDPLSQKLLIAYALSNLVSDDSSFGYHTREEGRAERIAAALAKLPPKEVQWPDQAAAIAYLSGNFEAAAQLSQRSSSAYAEWLRGKLALHAGDKDGAAKAFAQASKAFVASGSSPESMPQNVVARMLGENAIWSMSRSDYVEALYQLTQSKFYWADASYVAERVLTIDELKALVDKEEWTSEYKDILARRLMRAERVDEAVKYYTDDNAKKVAPEYLDAWHAATAGADSWVQAKGWYEVARLEVQWGMELSGDEGCPDAESGVCYDLPAPAELDSTDEAKRVQSSAIQAADRFPYRDVGVDYLLKAADRLPRKSRVLTAVLCNGAGWLHHHNWDSNEQRIQKIYQRYVKDGRLEPWAKDFGANCPEPEFAATTGNSS